ncbi:MAG TPA: peptide chain release factor N(5)-glutamine methyltransferase, partial [Acidimicrobiales bacterium]|nr:peptide chain release factor N(5)-glutamine methyltransferase [Acidimicrobiales bacterium]
RQLGDPLEARRLVEHVLIEKGSLTGSRAPSAPLMLGDAMPPEASALLSELVERRSGGEPLQHVLGGWGFRSLEVAVDGRALVPRPETETVVQHALDELDRLQARDPSPEPLVADLGTGSGVIALSIAVERPDAQVHAVDQSAQALSLAAENLASLPLHVRSRVHLSQGDWFGGLSPDLEGKLAVVVANPPYLAGSEWETLDPVVRDYDPYEALIAGPSGLEAMSILIEQAPTWLVRGGALVVEIAPHQREGVLALVASRGRGYAEATVEPDLAGRPRVLVGRTPTPDEP